MTDEHATVECNKCHVWYDVEHTKPDGHGKFLCVECAYNLLEAELKWMRREIERVGYALYTGTETGYVGTEEDLHCIGQTVEGVIETTDKLEAENQRLREVAQGPSFGEMLEMGRWLKGSMKIWDDYGHFKTGLEAQINAWIVRGVCDALKEGG